MLDSNIVIDLTSGYDEEFTEASLSCMARLSTRGPFWINHIIYAEVAPRTQDRAGMDRQLAVLNIRLVGLNADDAWRAGLAFHRYRQRRGPRESILPDFLIGGQAAARGWPIITRDPRRFASYFPELQIIDPTEAAA